MIPYLVKQKLQAIYGEELILPARINLLRPNKESFQGDEHDLQKAFFSNIAVQMLGDPYLYLFHAIPNGGTRDKITAGKLKAEGVKAGIPDTYLPMPRGKYNGFYMEFKAKSNKPDEDQRAVMLMLDTQGFKVLCVNHLDDAIKAFTDYYTLDLRR